MNPIDDTVGYMIVLSEARSRRIYEGLPFGDKAQHAAHISLLRAALPDFEPGRYRGISRYPLEAFATLNPLLLRDDERRGHDVSSNRTARWRFAEILRDHGIDPAEGSDGLVPTEFGAFEIYRLLDDPTDYEVLFVTRRQQHTHRYPFLGYDIGYWAGDHFSLVCDTAVRPTWHPCDAADFAMLRSYLVKTNNHALFPEISTADAYLQWYVGREWAEKEFEPGVDFSVIGVSAVCAK